MNHENGAGLTSAAVTALFNAVYDEHYRVVYAYLIGQSGDSEIAADLLQETFVRVWQRIAEVAEIPMDRRRFYFFAIARNLAIDERRRQAVRQRHLSGAPLPESVPSSTGDPSQALMTQETATAVDNAIEQLPPDLRTVLSLHLLAEMNSQEIGKALEIPASTVRYRLSRARACIAQKLGKGNDQ